jgi:hypothetical protein
MLLVFALVGTYIPQDWNDVKTVHAGAAGGGATEPTQILNNVELGSDVAVNTTSAGANTLSSGFLGTLWEKEFYLDALFWFIAKEIISNMINELVIWINSGFEGRPMFVQDLSAFLLEAADEGVGEFIRDIGGPLSVFCSPFRLDVQVAVNLYYNRLRADQSAPACTLTGVIDNIDGFLEGGRGSFSAYGGWDEWFEVVAKPQTYTPYGAVLSAQTDATMRFVNIKGEEFSVTNFGDGFISGKICEPVDPELEGPPEQCWISKPGKIVEEALSFNLDSGRQSLIEADEFNEVIAALLGQLANTALTGAAGLLGLTGDTGYSYDVDGLTYTEAMIEEAAALRDEEEALENMNDALAIQQDYIALAEEYIPLLTEFSNDPEQSEENQLAAEEAILDAELIIALATEYSAILEALIAEYQTAEPDRREEIIIEFTQLEDLFTELDILASELTWESILDGIPITGPDPITTDEGIARIEEGLAIQEDVNALATDYLDLLLAAGEDAAAAQAAGIIAASDVNIEELNAMLATLANPALTQDEIDQIFLDALTGNWYTASDLAELEAEWDALLNVPVDTGTGDITPPDLPPPPAP